MTKTATITYRDEQLVQELGFIAAAKLYELGRAATGVPAINLRGPEVKAEIRAARDLS